MEDAVLLGAEDRWIHIPVGRERIAAIESARECRVGIGV
jgi:hypothetical protein